MTVGATESATLPARLSQIPQVRETWRYLIARPSPGADINAGGVAVNCLGGAGPERPRR